MTFHRRLDALHAALAAPLRVLRPDLDGRLRDRDGRAVKPEDLRARDVIVTRLIVDSCATGGEAA